MNEMTIKNILLYRKVNFIDVIMTIDPPCIVLAYDISDDLKKQLSDEIFATCGVKVRYYIPSTLD